MNLLNDQYAKNLVSSVKSDFIRAWNVVSGLEDAYHDDYRNEEMIDGEYDALEHANQSIFIKLCLAFETLGAPDLARLMRNEYDALPSKKNITSPSYTDCQYCPATFILNFYFEALKDAIGVTSKSKQSEELKRLEMFLRCTPKMILDSGIEPCSEKEVQNEVYKHIIHVWPDTVREFDIPHPLKNYQPDFGVKSLRAAIEYKFVNTPKELKVAVDGIFEDITCYSGSEDWKVFFSIFYLTNSFVTESQVLAQFEAAGVPKAWIPIVVYGQGSRTKKIIPKSKNARGSKSRKRVPSRA